MVSACQAVKRRLEGLVDLEVHLLAGRPSGAWEVSEVHLLVGHPLEGLADLEAHLTLEERPQHQIRLEGSEWGLSVQLEAQGWQGFQVGAV